MRHQSRAVRHWTFALSTLLIVAAAHAGTVQRFSLEQIADHAGQVIIGRVADVRSYWASDPRRIESEITFTEVQYLKGALPDSGTTFKLTVPGGTVGDVQMQISSTPQFAVGEKWLLCLLPQYRTFPVVGLFQGAFLIRPDDVGIERLAYQLNRRVVPVVGVDPAGHVLCQSPTTTRPPAIPLAADGVRLLPPPPTAEPTPLSLDAFSEHFQPILDASRKHHLRAPAGQRVLVDYQAVALRRAAQAVDRDDASEPRNANGAVPIPADRPDNGAEVQR